MGKKRGKFDKSCYIPHQVRFARWYNWRELSDVEKEGQAQDKDNRKKAAEHRGR